MKYLILYLFFVLGLGGCSLSDQQIAEAVQKNPEIIFKAIEEKPERFMQVINNVTKKAQEAEEHRRMMEAHKQVAPAEEKK